MQQVFLSSCSGLVGGVQSLDATSFGLVTLDRQGVADQFSQQFRRFCTQHCHFVCEKVRRLAWDSR